MDEGELASLLGASEGVSLEFKKSLEFPEAIARTICAFANTFGGYLVIGTEKRKDETLIVGVANPDAEFQKLAGITSLLQPKPYYTAREYGVNGKNAIIIKVEAMPLSEVCFYKKTVFRRMGSINEEVTGPNLARFLRERGTLSFEENKCPAKLEDLSRNKIQTFLKNRGVNAKEHAPISLKLLLSSLGVANSIGEFYLKNAAVMFFAEDARKFFINAEVRVAKFRGKEKNLEALEYDERVIDTLPELLGAVFETVRNKAGAFGRIIDGKRMEARMIPDEVLREALTNAVGHRDYFDPNGILVEIFDDRLEITNPGSLLPGQSLKNLAEVRKHRNPLTYRLLNDSRWGEGLNLGIKAMYRTMRKNKLPDPEFKELGGMFKVTLFGPLSNRKQTGHGNITERQEKALQHLKTHESITAPQYAKLAGVSHPTAITDLNSLVAMGVLAKSGSYRSAKYLPEKL